MNVEHATPVGAPVVIAPGKIVLVGDYSYVEDSPVMVAAIARHAKAQFVPRVDAMPRLVADVVKRAQRELSDVITALPLGSILVDDEDFRHKVPLAGLGANAAVSVASAGALLETLGLSVGNRKSQILAIAGVGYGESGVRAESGADALAAAYGGLVQVSRGKDTVPRAYPVAAPTGLRLVLFSASPAVSPLQMVEGIQRYAESDPVGFEDRTRALRNHAQRFVDEIKVGQTTGAIAAARKYGAELGTLGKAARVPITTATFDTAAELAHELGGVAKPTGAGDGSIGVAMFATREAAELFRKAVPPGISLLDGDLDRLGVRCQGSSDEFDVDPTQVASPPDFPPDVDAGKTVRADQPAVLEGQSVLLDPTVTVDHRASDADTARNTVAPPHIAVAQMSRRRPRGWIILVATCAALVMVVTWLALPHIISAWIRANPSRTEVAPPIPVAPPSVPSLTEPTSAPAFLPPPDGVSLPDSQSFDEVETRPPPRDSVAEKPLRAVRSAAARSRKTARASRSPARPSPALRSGKLSLDDF